MFLSLVIPCYNEEEVIELSLTALMKEFSDSKIDNYEIICVDDGSKDKTLSILQDYSSRFPKIKVVSLSANRGQQTAVYAGLCYSSGDAVILMDADLQDPPNVIVEMIAKWEEGYHIVYGVRKKRDGENIFKRYTSFLFYRMLNYVTYTEIPKDVGDFRLMDRVVVDAFIHLGEHQRFNRVLTNWLGFKQYALPFDRDKRAAGETKWGVRDLINLAKDGLFSFSYFPLHFVQFCGIFSIFLAFGILCYALISYFLGHAAAGWSSLVIIIAFFSGMILFCLGLIGEYIVRIYTESLGRPIFIAQSTQNLKGKELPSHIAKFHSSKNNKLS